jgi:hypothetical protein
VPTVRGALAALLRQRLEISEDGAGRAEEAARILLGSWRRTCSILRAGTGRALVGARQPGRLYVYISGLEQPPCTQYMRPAVGRPATLESVFDVNDVDFQRAITFLDPEDVAEMHGLLVRDGALFQACRPMFTVTTKW